MPWREKVVVYCLFCETEKVEFVRRAAMDLFHCQALYPKQMQHTWSKGRMVDIERKLLPGYLFLYFFEEYPDVSHFNAISGVIRCLSDTSRKYTMTDRDKQFALMLLERNGLIGKTKVYEKNGRIHLSEGAFSGLDAAILKVDHRASRMLVEISLAEQPVKTWLEYEIVRWEE